MLGFRRGAALAATPPGFYCYAFTFRSAIFPRLIEMVGKRHGNTMAQFINGHSLLYIEENTSVSVKLELAAIHFPETIDQTCLAVEEHGVLSFLRFDLVDSHQAAAFGLGGEVAGLTPLQGFFQVPDAIRSRRDIEDQLTEKH